MALRSDGRAARQWSSTEQTRAQFLDAARVRVRVALLTSFMGDARREIASARSGEEARELVETMMAVLARLRTVVEADLLAELAG